MKSSRTQGGVSLSRCHQGCSVHLAEGGVGRSQTDAKGVDEKMGKGQTSNKDRDSIYYCV